MEKTSSYGTHVNVRVEELSPGVAREHVDDDDLTPFLHVNQQVAEFTVILMDQIDALWANLLERHHHTACDQLNSYTPYRTNALTIK